ncbi:MAG: hypothetical protein ABJN04_01245, partial [Hyphomicrobiales bacterium]
FASIPAPVDKVSGVSENFPGRAEEIERIKAAKEKKEALKVENQGIGVARAQPLTTGLLNNKTKKHQAERDGADLDPQINAAIGSAAPLEARDLLKTPEDHARERGITVDELPKSLQGGGSSEKKSLLARAGLVQPKTRRRTQSLTDIPVEYRTVKQVPITPPASQGAVVQNGQIPSPQEHLATASQVNRSSDPDGTYSVEPFEAGKPQKKKKRFVFF